MCNKSAEVLLLSFVVGLLVSTSTANSVATSDGDPQQTLVIAGMQRSGPAALRVRGIDDLEVFTLETPYESIAEQLDLVNLQSQFTGQSYGAEQFSGQIDYEGFSFRRVTEPSYLSLVCLALLLFDVAADGWQAHLAKGTKEIGAEEES
jgi:hypothetical protein